MKTYVKSAVDWNVLNEGQMYEVITTFEYDKCSSGLMVVVDSGLEGDEERFPFVCDSNFFV
jgi:hypothetical protein